MVEFLVYRSLDDDKPFMVLHANGFEAAHFWLSYLNVEYAALCPADDKVTPHTHP